MKKLYIYVALLLLAGNALAQDGKTGWQVELKKAALDITSTEVRHAQDYQAFSDARLNGDSQTNIRAKWDSNADYHATHFLWTNQLLLDYGRTKIRPVNGPNLENESADQILFTTGYTQRLWKVEEVLGGFEMGPFADIGYETEFTKPDHANRTRILRGMVGWKLFEGKYLKKLYAAIMGERDFTDKPYSNKLAWEAGLELEAPVREGVTAKLSGMYRKYISATHHDFNDLSWEAEADARLDVALSKELYVAPFISYYTAQGKYVQRRGENVYVGVSFSFSHVFSKAE